MPVEDVRARILEGLKEQRMAARRAAPVAGPINPWSGLRAFIRDARGAPVSETGIQHWIGGRVSTSRLVLYVAKPAGGRLSNSFARVLVGRIRDEGGVTQIIGTFRMLRFVQGFCAFWGGGVIAFEVALVWAAVTGQARVAWPWLLLAPGMLLFMITLVRFGGWLSQRDEAQVLDFLRRQLGHTLSME